VARGSQVSGSTSENALRLAQAMPDVQSQRAHQCRSPASEYFASLPVCDRPGSTCRPRSPPPGEGIPLVDATRECGIQRFDVRVADRNFGVDDRIDNQCRVFGTLGERTSRPFAPLRVICGDVQENVAIHQNTLAVAKACRQTGESRLHLAFRPWSDSLRVKAMISSVLMRVLAVPRSASSALFPLIPAPCVGLAFRIRA